MIGTIAGKICFFGSIVHMLRMYNIFVTEEFLLGFSTALQFRFGYSTEIHTQESSPSITCSDFIMDINGINNVLCLFNLKIVCTTEKKQADYAEKIKAYLKNGIPIMVLVDAFNLPYDYKEKKHDARYITCCEWRESEKKIEIIDTVYDILHNHFYQGTIDEDIIFANDMSNLVFGEIFPVWNIVRIETESDTQRQIAVKKHINIPPMLNQEYYKVNFGNLMLQYKVGHYGIKYLKEELTNYLAGSNSADRKNDFIQDVFKQLNSYTGPVVTRTLFYRFLQIIDLDKEYEELLLCTVKLRDKWENIGFLLIKSIYSANSQKLVKACEQLDYVIDLELAMQTLITKVDLVNLDISTYIAKGM